MKIKNLYIKKPFEALSKITNNEIYENPIYGNTMFEVNETSLSFKHVIRGMYTVLNIKNIKDLKIDQSWLKNPKIIDTLRISSLLKGFSDEEEITLDLKDSFINLSSKKGKYKLVFNENIDIFDKLFEDKDEFHPLFTSNINCFINVLEDVIKVCNEKDRNPIITVINFLITQSDVKIYATDTFRIARNVIEGETNVNEYNEFCLSSVYLRNYLNFLKEIKLFVGDVSIAVYRKNNKIYFKTDSSTSSIQISNTSYYDLSKHFDVGDDLNISLNVNELKKSISRIRNFIRDKFDILVLDFKTNKLILSSIETRFKHKGEETISCKLDGQPTLLKIKGSILKESIEGFSDEIIIKIHNNKQPFLITDKNQKLNKLEFVVMPIR